MKEFKEISISEVSDAIDLIGKEWMLIGAPDGDGANAMTASWGTLGVLWNKPVCICYIRPQRYTYGLAEESERLSFSFFGKDCRDKLLGGSFADTSCNCYFLMIYAAIVRLCKLAFIRRNL